MKQLFENMIQNRKAIFSININDMIDIRAVADCASYLSIPMIFNVSSNAIKYAGLSRIVSLIKIEKEKSKLPIFMQLDHAKEINLIDKCIKLGFDAIMADGSDLSFEKNIEFVRNVRMLGGNKEFLIEAQLGKIINTNNNEISSSLFTDPIKAQMFVVKSKADCLSISFGNEHNYYLDNREYELDFNVLNEIHKLLKQIPLVMHGADTISDEDIIKSVESGITKINIGPCLRQVYLENLINLTSHSKEKDPRVIYEYIRTQLTSYLVNKLQNFSDILYFI